MANVVQITGLCPIFLENEWWRTSLRLNVPQMQTLCILTLPHMKFWFVIGNQFICKILLLHHLLDIQAKFKLNIHILWTQMLHYLELIGFCLMILSYNVPSTFSRDLQFCSHLKNWLSQGLHKCIFVKDFIFVFLFIFVIILISILFFQLISHEKPLFYQAECPFWILTIIMKYVNF